MPWRNNRVESQVSAAEWQGYRGLDGSQPLPKVLFPGVGKGDQLARRVMAPALSLLPVVDSVDHNKEIQTFAKLGSRGREELRSANRTYQEQLQINQGLEVEVSQVGTRIESHFDRLRSADRVVIMVGCDDARQEAPVQLQAVNGEQVAFVYLPSIGGGEPDENVLREMLATLDKQSVDLGKVTIMVTQHGSTTEVNDYLGHQHSAECKCGARAVAAMLKKDFPEDKARLQQLKDAAQDERGEAVFMEAVAVFAQELRAEKNLDLPELLLGIAVCIDPGMEKNNERTVAKVEQQLAKLGAEWIPVVDGLYDHNLHAIVGPNLGFEVSRVGFDRDMGRWEFDHQNPSAMVISFGPMAATVSDKVLLNQTAGGKNDNDFNAAAVDAHGLERAFQEVWYALSNRFGGGHGANFANADRLIVVADNDDLVAQVRALVAKPEFKARFQELLGKLGGVQVVSLERALQNKPAADFIPFVREKHMPFLAPAAKLVAMA